MSNQSRGGRINRINPLVHQIISKALIKNSLEKNRTKIQKVLSQEMTTKNVPKIIFEIDNTINNVFRINDLLEKVNPDE